MDEATDRYLDRIREDLEPLLGPGATGFRITVTEVDDAIALRLGYRLSGVEWTSEATGGSLVEAHSRLRRQVVEDRLAVGFRAISD